MPVLLCVDSSIDGYRLNFDIRICAGQRPAPSPSSWGQHPGRSCWRMREKPLTSRRPFNNSHGVDGRQTAISSGQEAYCRSLAFQHFGKAASSKAKEQGGERPEIKSTDWRRTCSFVTHSGAVIFHTQFPARCIAWQLHNATINLHIVFSVSIFHSIILTRNWRHVHEKSFPFHSARGGNFFRLPCSAACKWFLNCRCRSAACKQKQIKERNNFFAGQRFARIHEPTHIRRGEATCSGRPGTESAVANMHTHTASQLRLVKINWDPHVIIPKSYKMSSAPHNRYSLVSTFFLVLFSLVSGRFLLASQRQSVAVLRRPLPRTKLSSRAAEAMRVERTHQRAQTRPKKQQ